MGTVRRLAHDFAAFFPRLVLAAVILVAFYAVGSGVRRLVARRAGHHGQYGHLELAGQ